MGVFNLWFRISGLGFRVSELRFSGFGLNVQVSGVMFKASG